MKKIALIVLTAVVSTIGVFAATSPIAFSNPGDAKTYGVAGEPIISDTLLDGYMLMTGEEPVTLAIDSGTIRVDKFSILTVASTDTEDAQFYLIDGKVDVASVGAGNLSIFTPWGKYFAPEPAMFTIISTEETEKVETITGSVYYVNALSNALSTIQRGEVKDMLVPPRSASFTNEGAFSLGTDEAYYRAGLKKPTAPSLPPQFTSNTTFETPVDSYEYNQADDWVLVSGDYSYFLRNSEAVEEWQENASNRPLILNGGLRIDEYTTGHLPALDEYIQNTVDGGVRVQEYAKIDTLGTDDNAEYFKEPGQINTQRLSISLNPYIRFANSFLEFRFNFNINPNDGTIYMPWKDHNFDTVQDSLSSIGEFISDINIENVFYLSRTRDLPVRNRNIHLMSFESDQDRLAMLLDIDLKYFRMNVFANDLTRIDEPYAMRSVDFDILPIPDIYPFALSVGAVYARTELESSANAITLFNLALNLPILKNDALSIGLHGGLPWFVNDEKFVNIWKSDRPFYAGLDISMKFGPFRGFVGADYSQEAIFTGFMDRFTNLLITNLSTSLTIQQNQYAPTGFKIITPYWNLGVDAGYGGADITGMVPVFIGDKKPTSLLTNDPDKNYNSPIYTLNIKLSAFVRPFNNESLKLKVEYDTNKIFGKAFLFDPTNNERPFAYNDKDFKKIWVPSFILTSETGPVFLKGVLDFDYDKNETLQPILSILLSLNLGSDYMFNASYYRERSAADEKRKNSWAPIVSIEIADDILPYNDATTGSGLQNNFRFTPVIGVEHPIFALTLQYEFSSLSFHDFDDIASWDAGKWIDKFVRQFRLEQILNLSKNSSYNIRKNSVISSTTVMEKLELDFNLFGIFGIRSSDFAGNISSMINDKILNPVDLFVGYRTEPLSAYISTTVDADWDDSQVGQDKMRVTFMPSANFDINIYGAHVGAFFATTAKIIKDKDDKVTATFGLGSGKTNTWDMLAGGTLGYSSKVFTAELTGGVQLNEGVFRRTDALTINSDYIYRIASKDYDNGVQYKYVPFFNLTIGGNAKDIFKINVDYTVNVSSKFNELYYDRLSVSMAVNTSVFDINALLEKRGAFMGDSIKNLWNNPTDRDKAFAYKLGITFKAEHINFTIEYENEFFGHKAIVQQPNRPSTSYHVGQFTFKSVIGLI